MTVKHVNKKKLTTAILLVFVLTSHAQTETRGETPMETKSIKLPKFPNAGFPKKSIAVSTIQLIQLVTDSVKLGYVQKGLDGHVAQLIVSKPLTQFLQEHITKMYKTEYKKTGVKLLWVLKELRIAERTNTFSELAYAKFNADAYISTVEGSYKWVTTIDTVFINETSGDVTAWHGNYIENGIKLLLNQTLSNAALLSTDTSGQITMAQIVERQKRQKENIPILNDYVYAEGAYANFQEFLQNKPSIFNAETVVIEKNKVKFVAESAENKKDTINVWGICKNGEVYKYYNDMLIPIEKHEKGFIVSDYVEKTNRRNKNMFMGALLGGVAGALIMSSKKELLVTNIPYITKVKKQPEASCIDMQTGEFSF
jgi:hypothetical protein